ncbi:hypothetical protein HS088_TW11G00814 [Tripterygium wilfordii]|uniref:Uncharacterized protein n=1 Tax=Tripterygium wilfordii TaxID=458696 RepID=A0A7J7D3U3_TRIWF|nr:hypothetical protein HS088_TW11G00814 [Tripterygium wilfordii]
MRNPLELNIVLLQLGVHMNCSQKDPQLPFNRLFLLYLWVLTCPGCICPCMIFSYISLLIMLAGFYPSFLDQKLRANMKFFSFKLLTTLHMRKTLDGVSVCQILEA